MNNLKNNLGRVIFNESLCVNDGNANDFEERLLKAVVSEILYSIDTDKIINELMASGAFKEIKISKKDLKRIAVNNLILEIFKDEKNRQVIDNSLNLMLLNTVNFDDIKNANYFEVLSNLRSQIKKIISVPIYNEVSKVVGDVFGDGEIFNKLIDDEINCIELIRDFGDVYGVRCCNKNIEMYKAYNNADKNNHFIESIIKKVSKKRRKFVLNDYVFLKETLETIINKSSEDVNLYMNDISNTIYSDSYNDVLKIVSDKEFLKFIKKATNLKYKKSKCKKRKR